MLQQTIQTIATAVFVLFASPIAQAITPGWWYGLGACLSGLSFIMEIFFVPETKYHRPPSSYQEPTRKKNSGDESYEEDSKDFCRAATEKPPLDFVNFKARTLKTDLRLWVGPPEWYKAADTFIVSD